MTISPITSRVLVASWSVLAVGGLAGTWYYNLQFDGAATGQSYYGAWFANPASSSAAVDVFVTAAAAFVFYLVEGRRLGWRWWPLALIPATFALALAFTFPLFLALRELTLQRGAPAPAAAPAARPAAPGPGTRDLEVRS